MNWYLHLFKCYLRAQGLNCTHKKWMKKEVFNAQGTTNMTHCQHTYIVTMVLIQHIIVGIMTHYHYRPLFGFLCLCKYYVAITLMCPISQRDTNVIFQHKKLYQRSQDYLKLIYNLLNSHLSLKNTLKYQESYQSHIKT